MKNFSRTQNKSVFTRRFNILKNQIRAVYTDDVIIDDTVAVRFGPESCIIAHDGAGFWDRGLGEVGKKLTELSHEFGECWAYVGDDERLHL